MDYRFLNAEEVIAIHDEILNSGELEGLARGKSLEGALSRIESRVLYGLIDDEYTLAALHALVLAQGHVFNDGNKRTAYAAMHTVLYLNGVDTSRTAVMNDEAGELIIRLAQGELDEDRVAAWLRERV